MENSKVGIWSYQKSAKAFYKGDFQMKLSKLKEYLFDHMSLKGDNVILRENLKVGIRSFQKNSNGFLYDN